MKLYTINEVATICGVTRATVYAWMRTNALGYVIVGSKRRVTQEQLEQFIRPAGQLAIKQMATTHLSR